MSTDSNYFKSIAQDVVYDLERTFPYASFLALETSGERITVQTRQQSAELLDPARGAVLTAFNGRSFLESATHDLSPEGLNEAAARLKDWERTRAFFMTAR